MVDVNVMRAFLRNLFAQLSCDNMNRPHACHCSQSYILNSDNTTCIGKQLVSISLMIMNVSLYSTVSLMLSMLT